MRCLYCESEVHDFDSHVYRHHRTTSENLESMYNCAVLAKEEFHRGDSDWAAWHLWMVQRYASSAREQLGYGANTA